MLQKLLRDPPVILVGCDTGRGKVQHGAASVGRPSYPPCGTVYALAFSVRHIMSLEFIVANPFNRLFGN